MDTHAEVVETHSATVVFIGDRAYKLKKPVDLGFLDFRSRGSRHAVCHREVELNRRLAPDVYLGVADVHDPDGRVCDHLVVMRRMPAERRLAELVRTGAPVDEHLWHVAHRLAAFHAGSPRVAMADEEASPEATRRRWESNTGALRQADPGAFDPARVERVQHLADRFLGGRRPLFADRISSGRAVDGHGDLLADDIFCLEDGPRIIDCIEFDDRLRMGDGLADAAFLAMDLERLGRPELGKRFLDAYREHLGDVWPASLAHHHIAYRAQVRAKVTAIRAAQGEPEAAPDARALLDLAAHHLEAGRVRLVLVGGLPGTGKSTLARALSKQLDVLLLRSDEVRKELAGLPVDEPAPAPFGEGIYSSASTDRTYATMLARAETALGMGETVLIDASWTSAAHRGRARELAARSDADLVELHCDAPASIAHDRIRRRLTDAADASDATTAIARAMGGVQAPWPEAITIDTTVDAAEALAVGLEHLGQPSPSPATGSD